jgi:LuxR family transcriptional regulator, maltose regulon positive regulatory protein
MAATGHADGDVHGALPDAEGSRDQARSRAGPPAFLPRETKLQWPQTPASMIARPRLVAALSSRTVPVVVLSAPAGSGKTLAVRQWLESDARPAVWLHLDEGDNDPVTLLKYLARALLALSPLDPAVLAWLDLPQPPVRQVVLPALIAAAASAPPFVLVLDDVHVLHDARCWRLVAALAEGLSAGSSIVLCGRSDPQLPLSRLLSQGRLAEYRLGELAFDGTETRDLLALYDIAVDDAVVDDLTAATEGWPAGVYLAVLAWRAGPGPRRTPPSGDRREIADYLVSEVLAQQPPDVVRFLTRTSIVPRLCPDLCHQLTGAAESARILQSIERDNLFLIPLDDRREWYRYHHLFGELLQIELERREPDALPELHRRAAAWFEAHDEIGSAIRHLLRAGDAEAAATLVAAHWWPCYLSGHAWTARQWVESFTTVQVETLECLRVAAAWIYAFTGEGGKASGLLAGFEPSVAGAPSFDQAVSPRSSVATIRALLAADGPFQMREDASLAVDLEAAGWGPWRSLADLLLGVAEILCGDDEAAAEPLRRAAVDAEVHGNDVDLAALGELSLLAGDAGRWDEAAELAYRASSRAAAHDLGYSTSSTPARLARDRLNAREGDGDGVADMEEIVDRSTWDFCPWLGVRAGITLAEALLDRGETQVAQRRLAQARDLLERWAEAPGLTRRIAQLERRLRVRASPDAPSRAELRVLELLPSNLTAAEIAERLGVSPNTVGSHIKALHRKLGATKRSEVVDRAVALGLVPPPHLPT